MIYCFSSFDDDRFTWIGFQDLNDNDKYVWLNGNPISDDDANWGLGKHLVFLAWCKSNCLVFYDNPFLSDYLTDLKLHRTKLILSKIAPSGGLNPQPPDHHFNSLPTELNDYLVVCANW